MNEKRTCQRVGIVIFLLGLCLIASALITSELQLAQAALGTLLIGLGGTMVLSPIE